MPKKSINIKVQLPASYKQIKSIQSTNYPYRRTFPLLMKSVIRLSERTGLDVYGTFGLIDRELAKGSTLNLTGDGDPIMIYYKESDEDIMDFYASSDYMNKQITFWFIQMMLRLSQTLGDSIAAMIYSIDQIDVDSLSPVTSPVDKPEASPVVDASTMIKVTKSASSKSNPSVSQKKTSQKKTPKSKPISKPISKPVSKPEVKSDGATDDILARANKLRSEVSTAAEGTVVKKNPLMGPFFDTV